MRSITTVDARKRLELAAALARKAGGIILQHYGIATSQMKEGGSPVTVADLDSSRLIEAGLRAAYPDDPILSEESVDDPERLTHDVIWIVDPLDGTKEFLARNGEFAVMIGLAVSGRPVLGVVYIPVTDTMYGAAPGSGAWVERGAQRTQIRCAPAQRNSLRLVMSRSHREAALTKMRAVLDIADVQRAGSVGIKCARVAEGERDIYIHPSRHLKEWDTCAPEALVLEAGGAAADCRGKPLRYNQPDPSYADGIVVAESSLLPWLLTRVVPIYEHSGSANRSTQSPSTE